MHLPIYDAPNINKTKRFLYCKWSNAMKKKKKEKKISNNEQIT